MKWLKISLVGLSIAVFATLLGVSALPILDKNTVVQVNAGQGLRSTSKQFGQASGVPAVLFELCGRALGYGSQLKVGKYQLAENASICGAWDVLNNSEPEMVQFRIAEGSTFKQIRATLAKTVQLQALSAALSDAELMQALGAAGMHPEGRFYPDTYRISAGSTDLSALKLAYDKMQKQLQQAWQQRDANLTLANAEELLILASIIEKETGHPKDRANVSQVFHNRLRIDMRLQTDPTVIYGMGENYRGNIRKVDLETDTPYNTYTRKGLTPTPIAMPSKASLEAAAHPSTGDFFYFVASGTGDGTSVFSRDLREHNQAVRQYLANLRSKP